MSNKKRRDILEIMSKGGKEKVTNTIKGMYGLTAYYVEDNKNFETLNLSEQVLLYKNSTRTIKHDLNKKIYLMPEQEKILNKLLDDCNDRICFQAPTSFGKSLLIKEYIYRKGPSVVVYIVPTNALAYELEESYKKIFKGKYVIFDSIKKRNKFNDSSYFQKEIFIGTQEKFFELRDYFEKIDLFVIDEAYKLEESLEENRGYILAKSLLEKALIKNVKLILLTPPANIIGLDGFGINMINTNFNAVDTKEIKYKEENIKKIINNLLIAKEKTVYYVNSPNEANRILNYIEENKLEDKKNNDLDFLNHLKSEYSSDYGVYIGLKKGVLIHHGQMPKYIQNKIIKKYIEDKDCTFIIGTNSLSEGINTPTKNIIFDTKVDFTRDKMLIKNTIGRAGRLGEYPLGFIYLTKEQKKEYIENKDKPIDIKVEVGNHEKQKEILDDSRIKEIDSILKEIGDNKNVDIEKLAKEINQPLNYLRKFLEAIKTDYDGKSYVGEYGVYFIKVIIDLANKISKFKINNKSYYFNALLYESKQIKGERYLLKKHIDKINYLTTVIDEDKTKVIDEYFKVRYSTLEYQIMPIINIYFLLLEYKVEFSIGINVHHTMEEVRKRYAKCIMYRKDFFNLDENKKKIIHRLNEYGVNVSDNYITDDMILEIEEKINTRYSMYDIINAIKELSEQDINNKNKYKLILKNYIY